MKYAVSFVLFVLGSYLIVAALMSLVTHRTPSEMEAADKIQIYVFGLVGALMFVSPLFVLALNARKDKKDRVKW